MCDKPILLMSDESVLLPVASVRHIANYVIQKCKTTPDATYYSEPRKMKNLDTTLIGTALLANKGLMLSKTYNFTKSYNSSMVLPVSDDFVLLALNKHHTRRIASHSLTFVLSLYYLCLTFLSY